MKDDSESSKSRTIADASPRRHTGGAFFITGVAGTNNLLSQNLPSVLANYDKSLMVAHQTIT